MEPSGGPCPHGDAPAVMSAKKLWRMMCAVYLVLVKKNRRKLAAAGVHLHHLLFRRRSRRRSLAALRGEEHPALTYLSSLSCRSMDPAAAVVVHPYPRAHGNGRRRSAAPRPAASSLSCRSMDHAAAVCRYQYRPREVEFSCKSTPLHKRRRAQRRALLFQQARDHPSEPEFYGSTAAVTRLFELMDVEETDEATDDVVDNDDDDLEPEATVAWPALAAGPAASRQVRITDSAYPAREEDGDDGWGAPGAVDKRAEEFISRFREQLRTQQQQRSTHYH